MISENILLKSYNLWKSLTSIARSAEYPDVHTGNSDADSKRRRFHQKIC